MHLNNFFLIDLTDTENLEKLLLICLDRYKADDGTRRFFIDAARINLGKNDGYSLFYSNDDTTASNVSLMRRMLYFLNQKEESFFNAYEKDPELKKHAPEVFDYLTSESKEADYRTFLRTFFASEINALRSLDYRDIIDKYPGDAALRIIKAVRYLREMQGFRDMEAGIHYQIGKDGRVSIIDVQEKKEKEVPAAAPDKEFLKKWNVVRLYDYLDETIVGQEEAKALAAEILYEHVVRIVNPKAGIRKSNYLMYGPTGSGKTEIWRQLRIISPVPIFIMDASEITMQGYKGNDKEDFFLAFNANGYGIEKGIIVLDEFDKLCQKRTNSDGENVGRVVQSELLKMIEGGDLVVDKKIFNTGEITFVCTGVFEDLFRSEKKGKKKTEEPELPVNIMQSLTEYGMIPELAGRISTVVALKELTLDHYYDILCHSKENCLQNLQKKYKLAYNIDLHLTEDAMKEVASTAKSARLGVRAMQGILERTCGKYIMELMRSGKKELHVTEEMIREAGGGGSRKAAKKGLTNAG